jgi:hypothetical protein
MVVRDSVIVVLAVKDDGKLGKLDAIVFLRILLGFENLANHP